MKQTLVRVCAIVNIWFSFVQVTTVDGLSETLKLKWKNGGLASLASGEDQKEIHGRIYITVENIITMYSVTDHCYCNW